MTNICFASSLATKPAINHSDKTITISETFARKAALPFTPEFHDLMYLREACPDYKVVARGRRKPRHTEKTSNIPKFVSYSRMVDYINLLPNSDKLMKQFQLVKSFAACHDHSAVIVFNWFNKTFPDYRKPPRIDENGNLIATINVVDIEDYKKSVEARSKPELPQVVLLDAEGDSIGKNAG